MRHFGQRIHDCRRNSKTFEQIAQKRTKKFGNGNFDGSRKRFFARKLRKFAEDALKNLCCYSSEESAYILFDMGTIPEKY